QGVRDYIKYIKRGYTRPTHLASLDVRNHRLSRRVGLQMVEEYEGRRPASLDLFLDYVGLTEDEFLEIARKHAVSPYEHDPDSVVPGNKPHDFDQWCRHGGMPRAEAEQQLRRWQRQQGLVMPSFAPPPVETAGA